MTYVFVKRTLHIFKRGDIVEIVPNPVWVSEGRVKELEHKKQEISEEIEKKVEDFKEDLADDGKRNYSNRKSKKSKK